MTEGQDKGVLDFIVSNGGFVRFPPKKRFRRWCCKHRAKPVPPISDSFLAYVDAAFMQKFFGAPKGERETDVSISARRMIPGLVLKYLKEVGFVISKRYETDMPRSSNVPLTRLLHPISSVIEYQFIQVLRFEVSCWFADD